MTKQDRYNEIAETIDELTSDEQLFTLWYLLPMCIRMGNEDLSKLPKTKEEFMCYNMESRLVKSAEEIREVIGYEIF